MLRTLCLPGMDDVISASRHTACFDLENILESFGFKGATLIYYPLLKGYAQERISNVATSLLHGRLLDPAQCL